MDKSERGEYIKFLPFIVKKSSAKPTTWFKNCSSITHENPSK